jgi:hypothetical protein
MQIAFYSIGSCSSLSDLSGAFTEASIMTSQYGSGYIFYNIDDITTAAPIPEPGSIMLLDIGLLGTFLVRQRRLSE